MEGRCQVYHRFILKVRLTEPTEKNDLASSALWLKNNFNISPEQKIRIHE
jgi:hypothetical protein